jgi:hypothetical protein
MHDAELQRAGEAQQVVPLLGDDPIVYAVGRKSVERAVGGREALYARGTAAIASAF